MSDTPQWYGVSSGDGNDGVSHMYADFYVHTDNPWRLAKLAAITTFKPKFQQWAGDNVEIDGEAEYTISACFYSMPDDKDDMERDYCPLIIEVFPEPDDDWRDRRGAPEYLSIEACFGKDAALSA